MIVRSKIVTMVSSGGVGGSGGGSGGGVRVTARKIDDVIVH